VARRSGWSLSNWRFCSAGKFRPWIHCSAAIGSRREKTGARIWAEVKRWASSLNALTNGAVNSSDWFKRVFYIVLDRCLAGLAFRLTGQIFTGALRVALRPIVNAALNRLLVQFTFRQLLRPLDHSAQVRLDPREGHLGEQIVAAVVRQEREGKIGRRFRIAYRKAVGKIPQRLAHDGTFGQLVHSIRGLLPVRLRPTAHQLG